MSDLQKHLARRLKESPELASAIERTDRQAQAEILLSTILEVNGLDCEEVCSLLNITRHEFNVLAHFIYKVNDEEPPLRVIRMVLESAARRKGTQKTGKGIKLSIEEKKPVEDLILLAFRNDLAATLASMRR